VTAPLRFVLTPEQVDAYCANCVQADEICWDFGGYPVPAPMTDQPADHGAREREHHKFAGETRATEPGAEVYIAVAPGRTSRNA
jgi:hypothetical protein